MKIAIIGAAGFVGTKLMQHAAAAGHDVTGYDLVSPTNFPENVTFQTVDISTTPVVFASGTEVIYYLAQSPFYREFPRRADHLFGVNVLGAIRAAMQAAEVNARFFCYASTGNVYQPSFCPLHEDHPVRRDDPYGLSKIMAEEALALFARSMTVLNVRLFGVFGPGQRAMLPVRLLQMIQNRQPITLEPSPAEPDGGGLKISFSYIHDVCHMLLQLATLANQKSPLPVTLNAAGPEAISVRQFAASIGKAVGIEPIFQQGKIDRKCDLVADITRLRQLLNPAFTSFAAAIEQTYGTQNPA